MKKLRLIQNNMKKLKIIFLLIFYPGALITAQEAISLSDCYSAARSTHPSSNEKQIQNELWQMEDQNLASGWYPEITAGASILYNSNVTDLSEALSAIPVPGITDEIGGMPHDQYKITLDINQVIWDGGAIKNKRKLEEASLLVKEQEIESKLYKVKERVNSVFFGLILLERQKDLLDSYFELVYERTRVVSSAIENGLMLSSDLNSIRAEKIHLHQQVNETEIKISSLRSILSDLTGMEILPDTKLLLPEVSVKEQTELIRPELVNLDYRIKQLEASKALLKSSRMPKAFGFATLGYGSPPGNDFFSDEFATYTMLGAGISWNIFDWNKSKRNRQKIDLNKEIISNRKTDVQKGLERALENKLAEIRGYASMLDTDLSLIDLRKAITAASESQFRNGTITSAEYMSILNLEKEAILSHNIHQVNYIKAQVEYLNIAGNEIK